MENLSKIEIFEWLHRLPLARDYLLMRPVHLWREDAEIRVEMRERFDDDCDLILDIKVLFKQEDEPIQKITQLVTLGFRWSVGYQAAMRTLASLAELEVLLKLFVSRWHMDGEIPACLAIARPMPETWPVLPLAA